MLSRDNITAANEVVELYENAKQSRNPFMLRAQEMRAQYGGDIALPLPELDRMERPAVANLIALGIDQNAMSIASVRPNVIFDALGRSDAAKRRADDRRKAVLGWWEMNDWDVLTRRRARHLVAYGETIVSVSPCPDDRRDKREIPHWRVRNPLSSFPSPSSNPDDMMRDFCIFTSGRSMGWFQRNYPEKMSTLFSGKLNPTDRYEVLEYVDDHETVLVALGSERTATDAYGRNMGNGQPSLAVLERVPNRIGVCPVVVAGRITLDKIEGQFAQVLGTERRRATLDALNTIAIFKNVFADEWAVSPSNSNASARIVRRADGKKGIIGIIDKGQLQVVRPPLNQEIGLALDRYEAATRQSGTPAQFSGESPSNIRTGRQFDASLSAAIDMGLQESQSLLARSAELEIYLGINIQREFFGEKPSAFFFGWDGKIPRADYTPNETFETDVCRVRYPMPGRDANGMAVAMGQKHGIGEMSLETMRENDPDIEDPTREAERVEIENLERAFMTGMEQGAAQGTLSPVVLARIIQKVRRGMTSLEATVAVDDELKQEQQQAQPQPAAPETAASPSPTASSTAPAQPNLQDLLGQLGTPPETSPNAIAMAPAPAPAGV